MTSATPTISITGTSGFVGKHLVSYLERTYKIRPIDWRATQLPPIEDSVCVHLAGIAQDSHFIKKQTYSKVNFEKTAELYARFLQSPKATKFIFISSIKAIEESPSAYAQSKQLAENYILKNPPSANQAFYILRPSIMYGRGAKNKLQLLAKWGYYGLPWIFDNPEVSVLYVENLCWVIKHIIEKNLPSGIYHIADEPSIRIGDFVGAWQKSPQNWFQKIASNIRIPLRLKVRKYTFTPLPELLPPLPFTTIEAIQRIRTP